MTKSYNPNTMNCLQGKMLDTWILVFWIMSAFPLFLGVPFYFANTNLPVFPPSMLPSANVGEMWEFNLKHNHWIDIAFSSVVMFTMLSIGQILLSKTAQAFLYACKLKRKHIKFYQISWCSRS